jgi:TatD family-associated radical SAM protein
MKFTKPLASCFTYTIGKNLYIPITSRSNAKTLPESRGPGFFLGAEVVAALCRVRDEEHSTKQWASWCLYLDTQMSKQKLPPGMELVTALPRVEGHRLPSVVDLTEEIMQEFQRRPDFDSIVFGGEGEPTLRLDDVFRIAANLKAANIQMLPPLRLTTNGLVQSPETVVEKLKDANILSLSVALMTANSFQYDELMTPTIPNGHNRVCKFLSVAIEAGLDVEVTAVDRPDVDKDKTQDLANGMGVPVPIRWRPFFP